MMKKKTLIFSNLEDDKNIFKIENNNTCKISLTIIKPFKKS